MYPPWGYGCARVSFWGTYTPWCLGCVCGGPARCSLTLVLLIWAWCPLHPRGSAGQQGGKETGAAAAGEFPTVPPRIFSFLRKSSCSILPLHTRKGLSSHTTHLSSYTGDCLGQGPTRPNSQLSPVSIHSLCVFTTLSLFPSLRLQATRSLWMPLKPCMAAEGAANSGLSQESCGRPSRHRPGAAVTLGPMLVPGTFLSWSNPLTICFFSVLYTFWSPIFVNTGVLLAVRFVPQ